MGNCKSWYCQQDHERKNETIDALVAALERSNVAIGDWLHQYAGDMCREENVRAAARRIIDAGGTLGYIADLQQFNHAALALARKGGG